MFSEYKKFCKVQKKKGREEEKEKEEMEIIKYCGRSVMGSPVNIFIGSFIFSYVYLFFPLPHHMWLLQSSSQFPSKKKWVYGSDSQFWLHVKPTQSVFTPFILGFWERVLLYAAQAESQTHYVAQADFNVKVSLLSQPFERRALKTWIPRVYLRLFYSSIFEGGDWESAFLKSKIWAKF